MRCKADSDMPLPPDYEAVHQALAARDAKWKDCHASASQVIRAYRAEIAAHTGKTSKDLKAAINTLKQVLEQEPVSPRQLNSEVDVDLETICLKCLQKEPAQRYASADELVDDLGRYLRQEPIAARSVSRPARVWRWCRRNPVVASLISAVVVSLV